MSVTAILALLQTALSLLALVQSNPELPQPVRDNAIVVAQNAINAATSALTSAVVPEKTSPEQPNLSNIKSRILSLLDTIVLISKTEYKPGEPITVSWQALEGVRPKDWVGIGPYNQGWNSSFSGENQNWFWTGGITSGSKTLSAPITPGLYQVFFYTSETGNLPESTNTGRTQPFTVSGEANEPPSEVSLSTQNARYAPGAPIAVTWHARNPLSKDWVGLSYPNQAWNPSFFNGEGQGWFWTNGASSGTKALTAPLTPGVYNVVFYSSSNGNLPESTDVIRVEINVD